MRMRVDARAAGCRRPDSDEELVVEGRVFLEKTRPTTRLIVSVSFILVSSAWLLFSGLRTTLLPNSPRGLVADSTFATLNTPDRMASTSAARIPFTINSTGKATGLFIFLHGLGDNGAGWCSMFEDIKQKNTKYIFPNAEDMPVTLNMGMVMPSWFDIKALDMSGAEDEKGIKKAAEKLRALMKKEQEAASVPSNRVILGGFSMGGSLALYTGLTHPEPLGGLVLLSSWLPLRNKFLQSADGISMTNQTCPIFQAHGDADPLVRTVFGQKTHELLSEARRTAWKCSDPAAIFKTYRGLGHSSSEQEMKDVAEFVGKQLGSV